MTPIMMAAALAASHSCSGFYSYLPADHEREVPFSVEVQPTAISVLYTDYSRIFAERQNKPDGTIQFYDQGVGGVNHWLMCSGNEAFMVSDRDDYNALPRVWRLVRTNGDIWKVAKEKGWSVGE